MATLNPILATILQRLEGPVVASIAQRLGIDPATANKAVAVAVPVILAVLAHRGASTQGDSAQPLGSDTRSIAEGISQASGLSQSQAEQMTAMLTPVLLEHLGKHQASAAAAAGDHAKQIAPALQSGDHHSIVDAVRNVAKSFQSGAPFGRLL